KPIDAQASRTCQSYLLSFMNDPLFRVLRVALEVPLRRFFDYLPVPEVPLDQQQPGCRVVVPFGRRTPVAVSIAASPQTEISQPSLRPAQALLDSTPILTPRLLQLCGWAADYYQHAPGEVYLQALPTALRQPKPLPTSQLPGWQIQPDFSLHTLPKQSHRQKALVEFLTTHCGPVPAADCRQEGCSQEHVHNRPARGAIEHVKRQGQARIITALDQPLTLGPADPACLDAFQRASHRLQGVLV